MNKKKTNIFNLLIFTIILFWCIGILWEIVIFYFPTSSFFLPLLKYNYSIVCHTQSEKLFSYSSFHTLVCSRCSGIYFGALISAFLIIIGFYKGVSTKFLILSSLPMLFDVFFSSLSIYDYSHTIALFTGFLLGSIGFFYIHTSLIQIILNHKEKN